MKTIYLVRHGESEINVGSIFGDDSSPLTEAGRMQAGRVAARAAHMGIDSLIASTAMRAQETASYISQTTGKNIETSPLFIERMMPSSIVGLPRTDTAARAKADLAIKVSKEGGEKIEDAESFDELADRATKALAYLESRTEDRIMVVGHGFFTRVLVARVLYGESLTPSEFAPMGWGLRTTNTGITTLQYDPEDQRAQWGMIGWNDFAHLSDSFHVHRPDEE